MTQLTVTAYHTRRAINWGILVLIAYIILRLSWGVFSAIYLMLFPPAPTPPNHAFGKLPAIAFPKAASDSGQFLYRLETIDGTVPSASSSALVFFMPKNSASLTALNKAKEFAAQLEFTGEPIQENKYLYRFVDTDEQLRQLRYDIISKNFTLRYLYEQDTSLFTERDVPLPEDAQTEVRSLLENFQLFSDDIRNGTVKSQSLKFQGDILVPTTSVSQADAIRIDYFRTPILDTKIFTPNPDEGPINAIFSGTKSEKKRILQLVYNYWKIDEQTTGEYSLKESTVAWQELQSGNAFIARYPTTNKKEIVIRKVYLGYYDSLEPQSYLQPIFVFEGDDNFLAYVSAVAPPWTE